MAEANPEQLQDVMSKFGFTEKEARAFIYLHEAERLFDELTEQDHAEHPSASGVASIIWRETHVHEDFSSLRRRLAIRVLRQLYPKGYGYSTPEDEK